jgi:hypothetical protein
MMIVFLDNNSDPILSDIPEYLHCMLSGTKATELSKKLENVNKKAYDKLQGLIRE